MDSYFSGPIPNWRKVKKLGKKRLKAAKQKARGVCDTPATPTKPGASQNNVSLGSDHKAMGN